MIRSQLFAVLILALATAAAWSSEPTTSPRFVPSKDGTEVTDQQTKLIWQRCVEGMRWDGRTCTGNPVLASHTEAIALAKARSKADGLNWRLPRVSELRALSNKSANSPGLDPLLFPAAPSDWYWTMTANVETAPAPVNLYNYGNIMQGRTGANANRMAFLHGWAVNMTTGTARGDVTKSTKLAVRLVRPNH